MDTHLTPSNEDVVREREHALRAASERADTLERSGSTHQRSGAGLDLVVIALFSVLAAGLVSLVVTTLQI